MNCLICNKSGSVSFRADYKLEIKKIKNFLKIKKSTLVKNVISVL